MQCIIDCGNSTANSGKLIVNTPKELTISTKLDATSGQPAESVLGFIKISLNFQEYEPLLTVFNFEVPALNVVQGTTYDDVVDQIKSLTVVGKFEDNSQKNLIFNKDYILELNRTDGGGTNNFYDVGVVGSITAIAISNNEIQATINLNVQLYLGNIYAEGTGPVYDNDNTSNRYVHYIEMGEYPQTYYGTSLPKAESEYEITADYYYNTQGENPNLSIIKPALYEDKTTGQKFAKQGTYFYNVEPVRWIVIGVTDGVYSGGEHVLFTTGNQVGNESSSSELWQYDEATNTFKYRTTTSGEWKNATEVLVLSEYGLLRSTYKNTGYDSSPYYNHFSQSDATKVLNTNANSLYNTMFTDNQRAKIIPKTMEITTYYQKLNSKDHNDVEYNLFLLGSEHNQNGNTSWGLFGTDSYNLGTYFKPPNQGLLQFNIEIKETSYSSGQTHSISDDYTLCAWWLRSSNYYNYSRVMRAYSIVDEPYDYIYTSNALRPAFVLNLA